MRARKKKQFKMLFKYVFRVFSNLLPVCSLR